MARENNKWTFTAISNKEWDWCEAPTAEDARAVTCELHTHRFVIGIRLHCGAPPNRRLSRLTIQVGPIQTLYNCAGPLKKSRASCLTESVCLLTISRATQEHFWTCTDFYTTLHHERN